MDRMSVCVWRRYRLHTLISAADRSRNGAAPLQVRNSPLDLSAVLVPPVVFMLCVEGSAVISWTGLPEPNIALCVCTSACRDAFPFSRPPTEVKGEPIQNLQNRGYGDQKAAVGHPGSDQEHMKPELVLLKLFVFFSRISFTLGL